MICRFFNPKGLLTCLMMVLVLVFAITGCGQKKASPKDAGWISLFNGVNLDGWTPKITGYDLGDNFGNTFRVEDGVLKTAYDQYQTFDNRFGHLFYKEKFSNYIFRAEYRFTGDQVPGGPEWAFRNSGVMIHCQAPESMAKDQLFPVCIEVQLLGGNGVDTRPTGNVCTPGTNVVIAGKLETQHCITSTAPTFHGDQWVAVEVEVHGNGRIIHRINGETVMEYEQPQLDPTDPDAQKLLQNGASKMLHEGYISLQSESHPVEFRKIELKVLEE
jgi:hypothetical protein